MKNMFNLSLILVLSLPFDGWASSNEDRIDENKLHAAMSELDKTSLVVGKLRGIRDHYLKGPSGFYPQSEKWFASSSEWLSGWGSIVVLLQGKNLASTEAIEQAQVEMRSQIEGLNKHLISYQATYRQGLHALRVLEGLDRISTKDLPEYSVQIDALNKAVFDMKADTRASLDLFSNQLTMDLETLAEKLDEILALKIASLALEFPELNELVNEVRLTLDTIKVIDRRLSQLRDFDREIYSNFLAGRVYLADDQMEELRNRVTSVISEFEEASLPEAVKEIGIETAKNIVTGREETIERDTNLQSRNLRFGSYYRREIYGRRTGLLKKCQVIPQPKEYDCALLRTIVGFRPSQISKMEDGDVAFIEKTLERVKKGPLGAEL